MQRTSDAKYLAMAASLVIGRPAWNIRAALYVISFDASILVAANEIWCCSACDVTTATGYTQGVTTAMGYTQ